jgi:phage shock protein E
MVCLKYTMQAGSTILFNNQNDPMLSFIKNLFSPADLTPVISSGAVIIDVRTKNEFDAGHLKLSRNIPLDKINQQLPGLKQLGKPVITVCRSGSRSAMAKNILKGVGIEAYNGGSWETLKKKYGLK